MVDIKDLYSGILTGLHREKPQKTMDKKLIINVAPTGSFTTREQNLGQPYTMEENVHAVVEAYKAGASVWHVHGREKSGLPSKDPYVLKETIARVLDKCPDMIPSVMPYVNYNEQGLGLIKHCVDVLTDTGPHYMQSAVLLCQASSFSEKFTYTVTQKLLTEQVAYLEEHGVRAEYQTTSYQGIRNVTDWLIDTGIAKDPPLMNIMAGFHGHSYGSLIGPDFLGYEYIMTMQQTLASHAVKGLCVGGRNWLPFSVMAIMLGFDMVRVGMEDTVYLYPHRDDRIQTSADAVRKVVVIANELGREIATPAEAKAIMGINPAARQIPAFRG